MLHFSCDLCGKDLPEQSARYVVKMEAFAAADPSELTEDDLDTDHVEEMAQLLNEIEDGDHPALEELPVCCKLRFDLADGRSHSYRLRGFEDQRHRFGGPFVIDLCARLHDRSQQVMQIEAGAECQFARCFHSRP